LGLTARPVAFGVTRLQFDRQAANLDESLSSAIRCVERARLAVARVEIDRDEAPMSA